MPRFDHRLMETKQHGTPEIPLKFYKSDLGIFNEYNMHWHREVEIVYIVEGKLLFKVNQDEYVVNQGEFIVISRGDMHSFFRIGAKRERVLLHSLLFSTEMLSSKMNDYCQKNVISRLEEGTLSLTAHIAKTDHAYKEILNTFNDLYQTYESNTINRQVKLKGLLFILLYYIIDNKPFTLKENDRQADITVYRAIDYIILHLNEDIKVDDIAKSTGYTKSYFMTFFKRRTGLTCVEFINRERLKNARTMLAESDEMIPEIASSTGFHNVGHFIEQFRKFYGITPHQYRLSIRSSKTAVLPK